ncbi:serine/threonine-protein phosphatase [Butyrivibrio sp. X503]|uniref:PP2C family protein-serine/threonine phosphatase n=1 Tax=Butyrivibrio sp. X503 TaxID=2364878 RepID=UPI000EA8FE69|nr:protein phosphatase 2C domain-containing protein [Butyrivibrio sp. X503]RKM55126.1 serine/threonine-protein phosphatase [Butyrivibrio sp. X503]
MEFNVSFCTDKGLVKEVNQDAIMVKVAGTTQYGKVLMAVLCDGMGGLSQGEVASADLVAAFATWFEKGLPAALSGKNKTERLDEDNQSIEADVRAEIQYQWIELINDVNKKLGAFGRANGAKLGTTVVAILFIGGEFIAVNVGDSRIYMLKDKVKTQITHDQSVVQSLIDKGVMNREEAEESPQRSVLLQCVGASENVKPQFIFGSIEKNTSVILCSDGFWRKLSEEEFTDGLDNLPDVTEDDMQKKLDGILELIKSKGEKDNISAIHIYVK